MNFDFLAFWNFAFLSPHQFDARDAAVVGNQVAAIIGILVTLVTAITSLVVALHTKHDTSSISKAVDGNLEKERGRTDQLTELLSNANVPIPSPLAAPPLSQKGNAHG